MVVLWHGGKTNKQTNKQTKTKNLKLIFKVIFKTTLDSLQRLFLLGLEQDEEE